MTSTTTPPGPPFPGGAPGEPEDAPARRAWPYWVTGVVAVLVALGTATTVALQPPPSPAPSLGELALRSAQDDAARLAALARSAEGQPDGQTTAGVRAALAATSAVLGKQASLLGSRPGASTAPSGGGAVSGSPASPGAGSSGPASASTTPAGTTPAGTTPAGTTPAGTTPIGTVSTSPAEVVARLTASVNARLAELAGVDGPTATLLASLAAGQALQAEGLASAAGLSPQQASPGQGTAQQEPASTAPAQTPCPSPTAAATNPTAVGVPSAPAAAAVPASGLSFADSLAAVDRAESASAYALETALARSSPGSSDATARSAALDAHRLQLAAVTSLAAAACVTLPPQDAGFAVPQGFAADPTLTLAAIAESAAESWAQLVGAAPGNRRTAAAQGLLVAGKLAAVAAPSSAPAFPGLPTANPGAN